MSDPRQSLNHALHANIADLKQTLGFVVELGRLDDRYELIGHPDPGGLMVPIARFELSPLPGCTAIAVSSRSEVLPAYRGRGIGKALHEYRIKCAKIARCTRMLCTVESTNEVELNMLIHHGWKRIDSFVNPETGHKVVVWKLKLTP